jgi:hypothetical protein
MPDAIKTGTMLIKEVALLPKSLRFESEPCASGWRLAQNLDGYGLGQKIHEAGWSFFWQAGEIGATVFGLTNKRRSAGLSLAKIQNAFEMNSMRRGL